MDMLTSMRRPILLLVCGFTLTASVASAQDDQIFVDPDSPSGKEYELPIDSARKQGSVGSQAKEPAQAAPLFGEGIERDSGDGAMAGSSTSSTAGDGDAGSERARGKARPGSATTGATAEHKAQAAAPDGAGGLLAILGVGTGVLLAGGLAGLLLRRRRATH